ncbi:phosphoenolpyruvate carboxykinase (ATP) [Mucilaginibacter sp. FT3.2]|uniref:phosphoenolpyruvate carboxykinase (ATP) n=1 Tax=Mucilaginibacter sp. FT3.2 TaxID=2723090 RepID=UPI001617BA39|nr:phosphoenolpyruvate carboxykinase (ATP) [Mucilaginibacter sp. FT3.2]MBB6232895.1 phosphoenolpyruvate carboxykinase (ATP) [Mucilaginibacter sp. FT3.2]
MNSIKNQVPNLGYLGIGHTVLLHYQLTPAQLIEQAVKRHEGMLTENGALAIDTGKFTGRSPKDRFIVEDEITSGNVWWSDINTRFDAGKFESLYSGIIAYLAGKEIFVRDAGICANEKYRTNIRVITETAYQNLFAHHLFIRPEITDASRQPEWTVIAAPGFMADPSTDGTRQPNFTIISFSKKIIIIGGTGYTGEIKKGIFSVLNFILPHDKQVLSMHCSANTGAKGDTALFFGLSGTGKTTLSADPTRRLIGDDEHGWSDYAVFNFEGGCYAKCAGLTPEKEPQIFKAIRYGALLENTNFFAGTRSINFSDISKTENTRVAYPLENVDNAAIPSLGPPPKNIFFLTADAFGILPPISRLTPEQAMYHFISGYTAKIAGTETGITEPKATFSACFGEAFLPLHPVVYAKLLGQKIKEHRVTVWLINTGWTGGAYGTGQRIKLAYTRAIITAALNGNLNDVNYRTLTSFNLAVPESCPDVPENILDPRRSWSNSEAYDEAESNLALLFTENFSKYTFNGSEEIANANPAATINI